MKQMTARAKSRLDELMFGTFNVRKTVANDVDGIGHIKGRDVIGLQETKQDGTSEIVASGYCVYLSGDCSGVKGRKG